MTRSTLSCVRCAAPCDAYACKDCMSRAAGQLAEIAEMMPAAQDIANGQAGHPSRSSGKPGSRLPLDLGATQRVSEVRAVLRHWNVLWSTSLADLEHLRHYRVSVAAFLSDVEACHRVIRELVHCPTARHYLGSCGQDGCAGDVYSLDDAPAGHCRLCNRQVSVPERRELLTEQVRTRAFRAAEIAGAYGVSADTIRSWAKRGRLTARGSDNQGRPLFLVGDVLDLTKAPPGRSLT